MNKVTKRSCIFCNKPAGSAEHALPKWLAKTMDREWEEILPASLNEIDGWKTKGKPRSANKLITKKVCHACNNGWMAKLEDQTKSNLQTLVDSSSKNFDRLSLSGRNIDYGTIVRWSIKTALCLNQIMPSLVEKLPPEASDWAISGKFPNSIFVYAGWINNSDFKTKISRGFRMFNGGEFQRNQEHRYSFDFSIQLNFFAIRVANAPDADWGLMSYLNGSNEKCAPVIWVLHGILWLRSKGCEKMRGWKHTIKFSANTTEECLDLPKVGRFPGWTCDWKTSAWNCVWVGRGAGRFARNVVRV